MAARGPPTASIRDSRRRVCRPIERASMFFSPRSIAALLLLATASCKTAELRHVEACVAPLDFVAWICADAARAEFPGADPLPYHAMAPATLRGDGSWVVRYERRADGRWAARAEGRVLAAPPECDGALPDRADYTRAEGNRGWRGASDHFELIVQQTADGPVVRCESNSVAGGSARRHVEAAAKFANQIAGQDIEAPQPCCAQHAPWRAQSRLRLAHRLREEGDMVAARSQLARAWADAPRRQELGLAIAMLDRELGQDELAAASLAAVAHANQDSFARAEADGAARTSRARMRNAEGDSLRLSASARIDEGDLTGAGALLLAARSTAPDPIADLALRHRLQTEQRDLRGTLGTALLLREYGAGSDGDRLLATALRQTGQLSLAHRADSRAMLAQSSQPTRLASATARDLIALALRSSVISEPAAPPR